MIESVLTIKNIILISVRKMLIIKFSYMKIVRYAFSHKQKKN